MLEDIETFETLKTAVMDIQVKFEFSAAVPANTTAYLVMISDRFYKLSSDGMSYPCNLIVSFIFFTAIYNVILC